MDNDRYYQVGSYDKLFNQIDELTDALASRDAEIAELKADAERYRWLCSIGMNLLHPAFAASSITSWKTKAEIDAGIDRARSTK